MDGVFEGSWLGLREELGDTDGKDVLGDNDGSDEREGLSDGELDSVEEGRLLRDGGLEGITLGVSEGVIFEDYVGVCCVALKRNVTLLSR